MKTDKQIWVEFQIEVQDEQEHREKRKRITRTQRYNKYHYDCRCGNRVFSPLPKTDELITERIPCPVCGTPYLFSTLAMPKKVGYPISRREWNPYPPVGIWV